MIIHKILFRAAATLAKEKGREQAAKAALYLARRMTPKLTRMMAGKGWTDKERSFDELLAEVDAMRRDGRLAPDQWKRLREELTTRWRDRKKS